jgi:hypothetical protein
MRTGGTMRYVENQKFTTTDTNTAIKAKYRFMRDAVRRGMT